MLKKSGAANSKEMTVESKTETTVAALDRMTAVFTWWGLSQTAPARSTLEFKRFEAFASDLQKACDDAYGAHMNALLRAKERVERSYLAFLHCRGTPQGVAAKSSVIAAILEETSLLTTAWLELSQQAQQYCATVAGKMADEIRRQATENAEAIDDVRAS